MKRVENVEETPTELGSGNIGAYKSSTSRTQSVWLGIAIVVGIAVLIYAVL